MEGKKDKRRTQRVRRPLNFGRAGSAWWMDASEGTASSRRECLTSLSDVATSCWPVADCVSRPFCPPTCTWGGNQKQMRVPRRFRDFALSALCLTNWRLIRQFLLFASNNNSDAGSDAAEQHTPGLQHKQLPGTRVTAGLLNAVEQKLFKFNTINTLSLQFLSKRQLWGVVQKHDDVPPEKFDSVEVRMYSP